jgi:hypothetical protein
VDPVSHFELPCDDVDRAMRFYKEAFGWFVHRPGEARFAFVQTAKADPRTSIPLEAGRINGSLLGRGVLRHPLVTIQVADLERTLAAVQANGGKVAVPVRDVGPLLTAYVEDCEGNVVGLLQHKGAWPPTRA